MKAKCDECGKEITMPLSRFKRSVNHFCCKPCHMRFMNRVLNPHRMDTMEARAKSRNAQLNRGEGKTYQKYFGRHTHRVVAEQMLGRPLEKGEIVHHIDGNKRNNDPSNLMVFKNQSEHARWHASHRKEVIT